MTGTPIRFPDCPIGRHLEGMRSRSEGELSDLDSRRSQLRAGIRRLDDLGVSITHLTAEQIASIPAGAPLDWIEAFLHGQG